MQKLGLKLNRLTTASLLLAGLMLMAACNSDKDSSHTTATTYVPPPPRQVLKTEFRDGPRFPAKYEAGANVDIKKPLLIFNLQDGKSFSVEEEVVVDFSLANASLKGDGGDYRIRYIIDDGEMQWLDRWQQVVLTGWTPGEHTIRLELIGPDGWPYRNGDFNVVTKNFVVHPPGGAV
jgi:hypothetical protein